MQARINPNWRIIFEIQNIKLNVDPIGRVTNGNVGS